MTHTLVVYTPALAHDFPDHPEHAGRAAAVRRSLEKAGVWEQMALINAAPATTETLRLVHSAALIEFVRAISAKGGGMATPDTYITRQSYELAKLAAGGCCAAIDQLMIGRYKNGFVIARPPGHHAEGNQISGFCLFNSVAVAARYAQTNFGVERILIIDFDVHHGNGTQDIFYDDPSVMFVSAHMFEPYYFYPGTGSAEETGVDAGTGYTLNVPFPSYVGDTGYLRAFQELILPKAARFQPQLILVSAGFDGHWRDPLAQAGLSLGGYDQIVRMLIDLAESTCQGKILFVLEGGYFEQALTLGALNLCYALIGSDMTHDPLGRMSKGERNVDNLLQKLIRLHLPS